MAGRNTQISRIYSILNLLEGAPQGLSVPEITARTKERGHDASKRTIYRDLEALNAAGFPLFPSDTTNDDSTATKWILEKNTRINQYLILSPRELVGLYFARQVLKPLRDTPFYTDLENLFKKIEEKLGTKSQEHLMEISSEIKFEPGPIWGLGIEPNTIDTVRAACTEGHVLKCVYTSVNSKSKKLRTLGPHYLYFAKGSLYLVAEDLDCNEVKVFSLPRMSETEMSEDSYNGQITDPEKLFKDSFGIFRGNEPLEIKIQFNPEMASFVKERSWHQTQKVISKTNGNIELSLHVAITPELKQWVLSFGKNAKVIAPQILINELKEEIKNLAAVYENKRQAG